MRACNVEFNDRIGETHDIRVATYAIILVHEATHGAIESCGIKYDTHNRSRIERLCVKEQNRFASLLAAFDPDRYPEDRLHAEFRESDWHPEWMATPTQRRISFLSRLFADKKPAADRAANGRHHRIKQ